MKSGIVLIEDDTLPINQFWKYSSIVDVNQSTWEEYLYELNIWFCWMSSQCPSNSTKYIALLSLDANWLFNFPQDFFPFTLLWLIPVIVLFKKNGFCCIWEANFRGKCCSLNPEAHKNFNYSHMHRFQMPYNAYLRCVEYLCDIQYCVTGIIFNQHSNLVINNLRPTKMFSIFSLFASFNQSNWE